MAVVLPMRLAGGPRLLAIFDEMMQGLKDIELRSECNLGERHVVVRSTTEPAAKVARAVNVGGGGSRPRLNVAR
jgi:hypothetical protein